MTNRSDEPMPGVKISAAPTMDSIAGGDKLVQTADSAVAELENPLRIQKAKLGVLRITSRDAKPPGTK